MHINNKYYCGTKPLEVSLIDTVKSRSEGYTNQHMNHAKMQWHIYDKVVHSSILDYKSTVWSNFLMNFPLTIEGVQQVEKIYESITTALSEKPVRYNHDQVKKDYIEVILWVLKANKNVTLTGYIMVIGNIIPLYVTISWNINFTTVENIQSVTSIYILEAMNNVNSIHYD